MTDELKPCPHCGATLDEVRQSPDSMLNAEQFDAAKRGDWFCTRCPPQGETYRYFWTRDLKPALAADARARPAAGASEGQAVGEIAASTGALGGGVLVWFTKVDELPIGTMFYTHPSAELTALRERVAGIRLEALKEARHVVYMALSLNDAFTSIEALVDKEPKQ